MEMHTVSIPSYWRTPFRHQFNILFCRHICSVVLPRHIQFRTHFPVVSSLPCPDAIMITTIMHQHACAANMIGMKILDLEVVDGDRGFQQFMLDCLDHDILAVAPDEDVPCAQVDCIDPTLLRLIEWMRGRRGNSCSVVLQMDQFIRLVYKGLDDLFISAFSRLRVCSVDIFPFRYGLDRRLSRLCQDKRSCNEAYSALQAGRLRSNVAAMRSPVTD